jgi:ATP-dependent DNA ligase
MPTPMLARLERELPRDGFLYEPKWDGFRCLAARDGEDVDLRSRNDRPFARYFPEVVAALRRLPAERFVVDGELVAFADARPDFTALLARLHPAASRVERLSRETPTRLIAFDLLEVGDEDLRALPFRERRLRLERLLDSVGPPLVLTPITESADEALRWLDAGPGAGIDGVVAKHEDLRYEEGARRMVKVKRERTADCVVAGFRWLVDRALPSSLLLGLYDGAELHHVGVATSFTAAARERLLEVLAPRVAPLDGHPWEHGFLLAGGAVGRLPGAAGRWAPGMEQDWVPVAPELVCEVAYDQLDERRFRHAARFRRWRPDRDPLSCTLDQLG